MMRGVSSSPHIFKFLYFCSCIVCEWIESRHNHLILIYMKTKIYAKCSSSTQLILCVLQNAMILFMQQERIMKSLEKGHYLYHQAFLKAISDEATTKMILHALMEILRYCLEHDDGSGIILNILSVELCKAIRSQGECIHLMECNRKGKRMAVNN